MLYLKQLFYTCIFHFSSYFISLSFIYIFYIMNFEKQSIFNAIKHIIEPILHKLLHNNPDLCKYYLDNFYLINNSATHLSVSSIKHNNELLIKLILIIIGLFILIVLTFYFLNIRFIPQLGFYLFDLIIIIFAIAGVEVLFFKLIASEYYPIV